MRALKLFKYQQVAHDRILAEEGKGTRIWGDAGTGKTAIILASIGTLYKKGKIDKAIIYMPSSLFLNWQVEIDKFLGVRHKNYRLLMLDGSMNAERRRMQIESFGRDKSYKLKLIFVGYGIATTEARRLARIKAPYVIADESDNLKNKNAKVTSSVRKVMKGADFRIVMSGTPSPQGWHDLWSQYEMTTPDVFGKWTEFKARYTKHGYFGSNQITGFKRVKELEKIVDNTSIKIKLDEVADLLPLTNVVEEIVLSKGARSIYNKMDEEGAIILDIDYSRDKLKDICRENGIKFNPKASYNTLLLNAYDAGQIDEVSADRAITAMTKLQQITGGFVKLDFGEVGEVGRDKLRATERLLESFDKKDKTLIFCNYRAEIRGIYKHLKDKGYKVGIYSKKDNSLQNFWDGHYDVFILQIESGGVGLNLQQANRMIFYSINFKSNKYKQAIARTHRTGQTKAVRAFNLIATDSIDEDIYHSVQRKLKRSRRVI